MILGQAPGKTHKGKTSRKSIFIRAKSKFFSRLQLGQPTKTLVLISNPTQIHWNLCQSLTEQQYDLCMVCCTKYHLGKCAKPWEQRPEICNKCSTDCTVNLLAFTASKTMQITTLVSLPYDLGIRASSCLLSFLFFLL
jgi:hypothetical protein